MKNRSEIKIEDLLQNLENKILGYNITPECGSGVVEQCYTYSAPYLILLEDITAEQEVENICRTEGIRELKELCTYIKEKARETDNKKGFLPKKWNLPQNNSRIIDYHSLRRALLEAVLEQEYQKARIPDNYPLNMFFNDNNIDTPEESSLKVAKEKEYKFKDVMARVKLIKVEEDKKSGNLEYYLKIYIGMAKQNLRDKFNLGKNPWTEIKGLYVKTPKGITLCLSEEDDLKEIQRKAHVCNETFFWEYKLANIDLGTSPNEFKNALLPLLEYYLISLRRDNIKYKRKRFKKWLGGNDKIISIPGFIRRYFV